MEAWLITLAAIAGIVLVIGCIAWNKGAVQRQKEKFKASYDAGRKAYLNTRKSWF